MILHAAIGHKNNFSLVYIYLYTVCKPRMIRQQKLSKNSCFCKSFNDLAWLK